MEKSKNTPCMDEIIHTGHYSARQRNRVLGHMVKGEGIGWKSIYEFLHEGGVGSVTINGVKQQIANLKASGDYACILKIAREEIEEEYAAELAALKEAEEEQARAAREEAEAEERRTAAQSMAIPVALPTASVITTFI